MLVVCHGCRRWEPMTFTEREADRLARPCPFRCAHCQQRGDIVFPDRLPKGYVRAQDLGLPAHRPSF